MRLWSVEGSELRSVSTSALSRESQIEDWLEEDIDILDPELLIIGRQISTPFGGRIDLLAVDDEGSLVVIELKRGKTSRDVVAQMLDYASWVPDLTTPDIHLMANSYFASRSSSFQEKFLEKFGRVVPEPLNHSHSMIIVASSLDPASSRIVEYLADYHEVGINTAFFNVFEIDGKQILAADWQLDQNEVVERTQRKSRTPWSGVYYVNVGDSENRAWEDMRRFGFISAGAGSFFSQRLYQLSEGDVFYAYQKQAGYVGKGVVKEAAKIARDVMIDGEPLLEKPLARPGLGHDRDDPELAEHVVLVEWQATLPIDQAKTFTGAFANQNVVCKLRDQQTLNFLEAEFT